MGLLEKEKSQEVKAGQKDGWRMLTGGVGTWNGCLSASARSATKESQSESMEERRKNRISANYAIYLLLHPLSKLGIIQFLQKIEL